MEPCQPRHAWAALLAAACFAAPASAQTVIDPRLTVETVVTGLASPSTLAFLGPDDILVLERTAGRVRRVRGGVLEPAVLTVPVNSQSERGLLGIAVNSESPPRVFLYYSEATTPGGSVIANRVYRYDWNPSTGVLESPALLLDLPVTPGPNHDGGVVALGAPGEGPPVGDGAYLYTVIGDLNRNGQLENFPAGAAPDDSAVIFRVLQDGTAAPGNPFPATCSVATATACSENADCPGGEVCLASYFAYGVRNSFGLAVDPVTGSLWDTENGPGSHDEVNLVAAGFNSGWEQVMGPDTSIPPAEDDLFDLPGSAYSDPEFSWLATIAPTAITFPHGSALGPDYDDVALVADFNLAQIYAFPLNGARDDLDLSGFPLATARVASSAAERDQFLFGEDFGGIFAGISDMKIGPDGALYVLSIGDGAIYRISGPVAPALPAWAAAALQATLLCGAALGFRRRPRVLREH